MYQTEYERHLPLINKDHDAEVSATGAVRMRPRGALSDPDQSES